MSTEKPGWIAEWIFCFLLVVFVQRRLQQSNTSSTTISRHKCNQRVQNHTQNWPKRIFPSCRLAFSFFLFSLVFSTDVSVLESIWYVFVIMYVRRWVICNIGMLYTRPLFYALQSIFLQHFVCLLLFFFSNCLR